MPLVHHELCFGCGRTNLFGLLLEIERADDGSVTGRCFIKQDHQGADPGSAHEGVIAAALSDAMSLACGERVTPVAVELRISGPAPIGSFVQIEARAEPPQDGRIEASAEATSADTAIASALGTYRLS